MKTIHKIAGLLIMVIVSSGLLAAQERESVPVSLQKISEHVFQVNGGQGSNGGVIIGENAVLLIDSKMNEESVNQTINAIKKLTDKPIKYLFNTHSDGDHIMGNRYLPESVVVMAHKNCRDDFFKENFGRESDWGEPEFYPFTPSVTFKNKMDLWLGTDRVEFYYFVFILFTVAYFRDLFPLRTVRGNFHRIFLSGCHFPVYGYSSQHLLFFQFNLQPLRVTSLFGFPARCRVAVYGEFRHIRCIQA